MHGIEVGAHRVAPAPHLVPRVRGHVVDVTRARNRLAEILRAGLGLLRPDRGLGGVHVEMARAGMRRVARQDTLEHSVQPLNPRRVHVALAPAWLEQEQRVGVERAGIEIVRVRLREAAHGLGVRLVLRQALLGVEVLDVTHRERVDVVALDGAGLCLQLEGPARGGVRERRVLGVHLLVEVRAPRPGLAPVADGTGRVGSPRRAERPDGVRLREREHHLHALVEVGLRFRVGRGDLTGEGAERLGHQRDRLRDGRGKFARLRRAGLPRGRRWRGHRVAGVRGRCRLLLGVERDGKHKDAATRRQQPRRPAQHVGRQSAHD